jgi:hypothetical protein
MAVKDGLLRKDKKRLTIYLKMKCSRIHLALRWVSEEVRISHNGELPDANRAPG